MEGLVVDNFAGGGGASTGIAWAIGRDPDIAINHSPQAIAMHRANHPSTRHLIEDGGPDLSAMPSALAYPSAEIEAFVSSHVGRPVIFDDCAHAGCDASAWESWRFRAV